MSNNLTDPVLTEDEMSEAQTLFTALMAGAAGVQPAVLDGNRRVLVATVPHPENPAGEIPVAIFITQKSVPIEDSLYMRLTPVEGRRLNPDGTSVDDEQESA